MPTRRPVIAKSNSHLFFLVTQAIDRHGPECDLNHIDVSGIEDFSTHFKNLDFRGDISGWDTSNAQTMAHMFEGTTFNGNIAQWNVSRVSSMAGMFTGALFNNGISNWNTGALVNANLMFNSSAFMGDISRWNMSNVASTARMFQSSPFNGDIANWDLSNLSDAHAMFAFSAFDGDLSRWNLTQPSRYCNMAEMFQCNEAFSGDLSQWALANGSHTVGMFSKEFKGVLPRGSDTCENSKNNYTFYQKLFDHDDAFDAYLAERPFSHSHAHALCASAICPPWFPPKDRKWFKEVAGMANGIGMDPAAMAIIVLNQYRERHGQKQPSESWDMGIDALVA